MTLTYSHKTAIRKLAEGAKELAEAIEQDVTDSHVRGAQQASYTNPYAVMQVQLSLDQIARDSIESRKKAYRTQVEKAFNEALKTYEKELSIPPSDEALSLLKVLQMRKSLTQAEIEETSRAYGSNHQFASALSELARVHKLDCPDPITPQIIEALTLSKNGLIRCATNMGQDGVSSHTKAAIMNELVNDALNAVESLEGSNES